MPDLDMSALYTHTMLMAHQMVVGAHRLMGLEPILVALQREVGPGQYEPNLLEWAGGVPDDSERVAMINDVITGTPGKLDTLNLLDAAEGQVVMTPVNCSGSIEWEGGAKIGAMFDDYLGSHRVADSNWFMRSDRLFALSLLRKLAFAPGMKLHHVGWRVATIQDMKALVSKLERELQVTGSWVRADDHVRCYIPMAPGYFLEIQVIPGNTDPGLHWDFVMDDPVEGLEWIAQHMQLDGLQFESFGDVAPTDPVGAVWLWDIRTKTWMGVMAREEDREVPQDVAIPTDTELLAIVGDSQFTAA